MSLLLYVESTTIPYVQLLFSSHTLHSSNTSLLLSSHQVESPALLSHRAFRPTQIGPSFRHQLSTTSRVHQPASQQILITPTIDSGRSVYGNDTSCPVTHQIPHRCISGPAGSCPIDGIVGVVRRIEHPVTGCEVAAFAIVGIEPVVQTDRGDPGEVRSWIRSSSSVFSR